MRLLLLVLCITGMISCSEPHRGTTWIRNVSVVNVRDGSVTPNQQVLIQGDSISGIYDEDAVIIADDTIDGTGRFLIPGLWDMHTHNWWDRHFSGFYIANGVLGVRNMYTPMQLVGPLRDSIDQGLIPGPKYFAAGRVIEGPSPEFADWLVVDSMDDIGPALDSLQAEGSDFVKVYNKIDRDLYLAILEEAKKRGMIVAGHVPMDVPALVAAENGHRSIEHLLSLPELCTSDTLFQGDFGRNWFRAVMSSDDLATMSFDDGLASRHFYMLTKYGTYVCPTLTVWRNYLELDRRFEEDGVSHRFPSDVRNFWFSALKNYQDKDSLYRATAKKKYESIQRVTKLLFDNGVPLMTGTDAINPCVYPGFSMHTELVLMQQCGIPDKDVLKMATINPCEFLGIADKYGTAEPGKKASLVLLSADPTQDISACKQIEGVFLEGKFYDKAALDAMVPH